MRRAILCLSFGDATGVRLPPTRVDKMQDGRGSRTQPAGDLLHSDKLGTVCFDSWLLSDMTTKPPSWKAVVDGTDATSLHAHFDCFSGAAGDMLLAACLDASGDPSSLLEHVCQCLKKGIPEIADEFGVTLRKVQRGKRSSIAASKVDVQSRYQHKPAPVPTPSNEAAAHSHDHDHGHRHCHERSDSHNYSHQHQYNEPDHNSSATDHVGPLRNFPQIQRMLLEAEEEYIAPWVKKTAIQVFQELAQAEAQTHGSTLERVHFHEVGAVDSIVDTVGTVLALHALGVTSVSCSRLSLGEGMCWGGMHGLLPVPAPATLRLLQGMPVCSGPPGAKGELVTPTGAAFLRVLTKLGASSMAGKCPNMTLRAVGHGAGTKDFEKHPNIVRLMMGDSLELSKT